MIDHGNQLGATDAADRNEDFKYWNFSFIQVYESLLALRSLIHVEALNECDWTSPTSVHETLSSTLQNICGG